jgi:predicted anti-sigma-YlaC factor YlaD
MDVPPPDPGCTEVREALSAQLDGERLELSSERLRAHLARCGACAAFDERAVRVTRRARIGAAAAVPDLTAPILTSLADRHAGAGDRRTRQLRGLVALAGAVQLAFALPALLGLLGPDLHLGRDLGALQLALGVGFLFAAWQPARAAGVLPVATVVALGVVVTAGSDVVRGAATVTAELTHLSELVGVVVLWALRRRSQDMVVPPSPLTGVGPATARR